jgi:hypothetical protein
VWLARRSGAGHDDTGIEAGVGPGSDRFLDGQGSEVSEFLLFPLQTPAYSSAVERAISWSGGAAGSAGNKGISGAQPAYGFRGRAQPRDDAWMD